MDFSSNSKATVSQLAGPLNGVIHDPTTATADQLFSAVFAYRLRALKEIAGPKLALLFHEAKRNRSEVVNYSFLETEISVDFSTFGPRVAEDDNFSVGFDPDIGEVAFHRATRLARVAHELVTPEDSSRLGATLPEEVLLDLFAYTLIDHRRSEGREFPTGVDQEIARRREVQSLPTQLQDARADVSHLTEPLEEHESGQMSLGDPENGNR